ncbi:MAG: formylglycine-generating enzyme family protein [Terriglobia bacterium]
MAASDLKDWDTRCVGIPSGAFPMGCEQGRDDEKPVHTVRIDSFELATLQVRNRDFAVFMEAAAHPSPPEWDNPYFNHPDQPVVGVSWVEAVKYCRWLSSETGRRYRLPTEAEWEWSAKGGRTASLYPWGNESPGVWPPYLRRWSGEVKGPLPVGLEKPNPYGLYDVSENVHEWCADWYQKDFYAVSPQVNPQGPLHGERRASRGGSWRHQIKVSRCAARSSIPPFFQYADYGFRIARDPLQASPESSR